MDIFFGKDMRREPHEERWINEERSCFYTGRQIPEKRQIGVRIGGKADRRFDAQVFRRRRRRLIPFFLKKKKTSIQLRVFATLDRA